MSKTIYLYLKTHNVTGLKYLGKTTQDPEKYIGSGFYWKRHLKKHGNDVTTEILFETQDKEEFKKVASNYSEKYNIIESEEFANMRIESGDGGDNSEYIDYSKVSLSNKGKKRSEDAIQRTVDTRRKGVGFSQRKNIPQDENRKQKRLEASKKVGYDYNKCPEKKKKELETKIKNGTLYPSEETKKKRSESLKKYLSENPRSEEIKSKAKKAEMITKNTQEWKNTIGKSSIEKRTQTISSEEWKKSVGHSKKQKEKQTKSSKEWIDKNTKTCYHCGKSMLIPSYTRWHGENCKHKQIQELTK